MIKQKFINVLCIGDCGVGKSTTLRRLCEDNLYEPNKYFPTIGLETLNYKTVMNGTKISLNMWDISGNKRFRSVALGFLRRCPVVCVFFDKSDINSFNSIDNWINWVKASTSGPVKFFLIGILKSNGHCDGEDYANEHDMEYYEMSAFDMANSAFAMNSIVKSCLKDDEIEFSEKINMSIHRHESYTGCPCM
jgi:small GTP-binding protein